MRICLLSYQGIHRKTVDVLFVLKGLGYDDVCVYAKPYYYKKTHKPIYSHRPSEENLLFKDYKELVKNLDYEVRDIDSYEDISEPAGTVLLYCGGGLIPESVIKKYTIINAHPGFIPYARGLDALKWAIVENSPIGVTTHLIGDYVDAGEVIKREEVKVDPSDTFHAVAQRVYDTEVRMLVEAISCYDQIAFFTDGEDYPVHKRMKSDVEQDLLKAFEQWKLKWCNSQKETN